MSVTLIKGYAVIETRDGTKAYEEKDWHEVVIYVGWVPRPVFHRQVGHYDRAQQRGLRAWQATTDCGLPLYASRTEHDGTVDWSTLGRWIPIRLLNHGVVRPCRRCWP